MMVDLSRLTTEQRNPATMDLDQMSPLEIAAVMNQEDKKAVLAVQQVLPQVATAIQWAADSLRQGGRLIYMGAGTSGRLGVLDAVECPPTFGSAPETVVGLIAGGDCAFVKAVEGAEDSCTLGAEDLQHIHLQPPDLVVGLAASGRTPYVIHGLRYARSIGCKTVAIACNAGSLIGQEADLAIEPVTGPEVLTGSTRLKAGTAQKLILNMISTGSMVHIGKAYQNLMEVTDCSRTEAAGALQRCSGNVKQAIVTLLEHCSPTEAHSRLEQAQGHIRQALKLPEP